MRVVIGSPSRDGGGTRGPVRVQGVTVPTTPVELLRDGVTGLEVGGARHGPSLVMSLTSDLCFIPRTKTCNSTLGEVVVGNWGLVPVYPRCFPFDLPTTSSLCRPDLPVCMGVVYHVPHL